MKTEIKHSYVSRFTSPAPHSAQKSLKSTATELNSTKPPILDPEHAVCSVQCVHFRSAAAVETSTENFCQRIQSEEEKEERYKIINYNRKPNVDTFSAIWLIICDR